MPVGKFFLTALLAVLLFDAVLVLYLRHLDKQKKQRAEKIARLWREDNTDK
jgi:hypothetical protein